jgi:3-dehydroquinate dehydratase
VLITSGKVKNGAIQLDGVNLHVGKIVTVLAHEGGETFEMDGDQEAELLAAIASADRSDFVDFSSLVRSGRQNA